MTRKTLVPSRKWQPALPQRRSASPRGAAVGLLYVTSLCAALACADAGYRGEPPPAEGGAGTELFPSLTRPGSAGTPGLGTAGAPALLPGSAGMPGTAGAGGSFGLGSSDSSDLDSDSAGSSGSAGAGGAFF